MEFRKKGTSNFRLFSIIPLLTFLIIALLTLLLIENRTASLNGNTDFFKKDGKIEKTIFSSFPVTGSLSTLNWERENTFINDNIFLFQGGGYQIKDLNQINPKDNPNPINVVIFGDSHTWGNGNVDRYATITQMIQDKLDKIAGKNVFSVRVLASNGASTYLHYDFFTWNSVSKYKPDLVIYNYFNNDIEPAFNESLICRSTPIASCPQTKSATLDPSYQNCIHGTGDPLSRILGALKFQFPNIIKKMLDQHCQPIFIKAEKRTYDPQDAVKHPFTSPYFNTWVKAVNLLYSTLRKDTTVPIAIADLKDFSIPKDVEDRMISLTKSAGFDVIPMVETEKSIYNPRPPAGMDLGAYIVANSFINPGNSHTASHINNLFATDIVGYILKKVPTERLNQAKSARTSQEDKTPLIAYTLPYFDTKIINTSPNQSIFTFSKSFETPYTQRTSSVEQLPFQYVNCANLGVPNIIITLNKNKKTGSLLLSDLPQGIAPNLGFYSYDDNYRLIYTPVGKYTGPGQILKIPPSALSYSLVLSFPDPNLQNCEYNKEIVAPDFSLSIKYLP